MICRSALTTAAHATVPIIVVVVVDRLAAHPSLPRTESIVRAPHNGVIVHGIIPGVLEVFDLSLQLRHLSCKRQPASGHTMKVPLELLFGCENLVHN